MSKRGKVVLVSASVIMLITTVVLAWNYGGNIAHGVQRSGYYVTDVSPQGAKSSVYMLGCDGAWVYGFNRIIIDGQPWWQHTVQILTDSTQVYPEVPWSTAGGQSNEILQHFESEDQTDVAWIYFLTPYTP